MTRQPEETSTPYGCWSGWSRSTPSIRVSRPRARGGAGDRRSVRGLARRVGVRGAPAGERNPGRPSLVAIARGTGGGRSLADAQRASRHRGVSGSWDEGRARSAPRIEDGKLFGRGACDMKGAVSRP
ncbi:hypothetical protein ACRAWF_27675 [Streptomyces sp. L7]